MKPWERYLNKVYYSPSHPASFSSFKKVYDIVKKEKKYKISRKKLSNWLYEQETYTLHKQSRKKFKRNRVVVSEIDQQWDSDLAFMLDFQEHNNGMKYIFLAIDIFSRYVWTEAISDKKPKTIIQVFKNIFSEGRKPQKIRTDHGGEFKNRYLKSFMDKENVEIFVTQNEGKANYAERAIKTIKSKLFKLMSSKNTKHWVDVLQHVTKSYNNTIHSAIERTPASVTKEIENALWSEQYSLLKPAIVKQYRIKVGQWVRLSHLRKIFTREYQEHWTRETFKVVKRRKRNGLPLYSLQDWAGDDVEGFFYEEELQPIILADNPEYKIEKILKTKGSGKNKQHLIRWLGWNKKFDSWINADSVKDIQN